MLNQSDVEKIDRFSEGQVDFEEEQYVYTLFSKNEENREFKQYFLTKWNNFLAENDKEDYHLGFLLDRIHHLINKKGNKENHSVVKRIYKWYTAAAALLIPIMIAGGIWLTKKNGGKLMQSENSVTSTLVAPPGSRVSFSLPDGTSGWLNSCSSLEYNVPFKHNRKVKVLGEAWFNVAHDRAHPFEVVAGDSKIKVLGTKFNLNTYPEDKYVEVVLEEGEVEFSTPGLSSDIKIKPNERLVLSNGHVKIGLTEASGYSAWIKGKLVFRGDSLPEVIRRIERFYNVEVELVDEELKKFVIRGTFQDDALEDVFRYLSLTFPIRYRIIDRKVLSDGTFQKKKVLLYKK